MAVAQTVNSANEMQVMSPMVVKKSYTTDPLAPTKAAFYSAILPGLGQVYNKSYWKVPIVYGAIGTGVFFYIRNDNEYKRYRKAYKRRLDGFTDDEFYGNRVDGRARFSEQALRNGQNFYRRNKELSLLVTVGLYALNILEASVHAHLKQYNIDGNLAVEPFFNLDENLHAPRYGLSVNFKF